LLSDLEPAELIGEFGAAPRAALSPSSWSTVRRTGRSRRLLAAH